MATLKCIFSIESLFIDSEMVYSGVRDLLMEGLQEGPVPATNKSQIFDPKFDPLLVTNCQ